MKKSEKRWKLLKSKPIFETKWMSLYSNDYELPNGKVAKDYFHLARPNYVLIIAIDDSDRIVVEKNYRRGVDDFVYELPAGWLDEGETPEEAAERELKEETGYIGKAEMVGELYPQPGFSSMKAYGALVRINKEDKGEQELGHDEHIDYELIDLDEVQKMLKDGKIKDMGFLSLLTLVRNRI
ncbi:NUDIX hydrolase [Candidatus Woesebacteria bacterium]|nr:NUDIX hydrolase [Candidatus Woesebacteria bacterium]